MQLSIVIPVFNASELLIEVIDSVLDLSSEVQLEIILVFNGPKGHIGPEEVYPILRKTGIEFTILEETLADAPNARNIGLKKSKGDYVKFLDSDDIIRKEPTLNQILKLAHSNVDVTTSNHINLSPNNGSNGKFESISSRQFTTPLEGLASGAIGITSGAIFRRSSIQSLKWKVGLPCNQEKEFYLECFKNGLRFAHHPEPTFLKHSLEGSISESAGRTGVSLREVARFRLRLWRLYKTTASDRERAAMSKGLFGSLRSLEKSLALENMLLMGCILFSTALRPDQLSRKQCILLLLTSPFGYCLVMPLWQTFLAREKK